MQAKIRKLTFHCRLVRVVLLTSYIFSFQSLVLKIFLSRGIYGLGSQKASCFTGKPLVNPNSNNDLKRNTKVTDWTRR